MRNLANCFVEWPRKLEVERKLVGSVLGSLSGSLLGGVRRERPDCLT